MSPFWDGFFIGAFISFFATIFFFGFLIERKNEKEYRKYPQLFKQGRDCDD